MTNRDELCLEVSGMDCGACALTIEQGVAQLPGVDEVSVSFATERLTVRGRIAPEEVEALVRGLGYEVRSPDQNGARAGASSERPESRGVSGFLGFLWSKPSLRTAALVAAIVLGGLALLGVLPLGPLSVGGLGAFPLRTVLLTVAAVVVGAPIVAKGVRALVHARKITIDLLMSIASIGALGIGESGEALTVLLLFTLGEALEAYSADRARSSLRSLLALQPGSATVLTAQDDGSDHPVERPVADVAVGARVLVRPGERIPLDGVVARGVSSIDVSPVTGESVPIRCEVGDEVMAGTVNQEAGLEVRVTRPSDEGTIARIARLVEGAQAQRSPAERFIDRFARVYTPAVVVLAGLVVLVPVLGFGAPLLDTPDGTRGWLYRGLALLIIACPCALVISIPVTVVSGLTRLARLGVLVRSGALLDRLADVQIVAFDKTGTLTHGRPVVTSVRTPLCDHEWGVDGGCTPCAELIVDAAAVEHGSAHPVAEAVRSAADGSGRRIPLARDVVVHPGRGVSGTAACGHSVTVGSSALFRDDQEGWRTLAPLAGAVREAGETVMYVAHDDRLVGCIGVQDEVRADSERTLAELRSLRPPVRSIILTGDHADAAQRVVAQVPGVEEVRASLLPEDKLEEVDRLIEAGAVVAMVGDGINDAPALARADIGIAMGGAGSAQAMETADVVLMQDDLARVPSALRIARLCRRVVAQNIWISLGLKVAVLGLAMVGSATLWMAVLADVGATLLVTLNGMRLLRAS